MAIVAAPVEEAEAPQANLHQRILAVAAEIGQIKATGKTAQGAPTLSIEDVEDALRELLSKHGVDVDYSFRKTPRIVGQEGREGKVTIWQVDLEVRCINVDDPGDHSVSRISDIGTSPSAAVSFALKRYYRARFHLADAEDEKRSVSLDRSGFQPVPRQRTGYVRNGAGVPSDIVAVNEALPENVRWFPKKIEASLKSRGVAATRAALMDDHFSAYGHHDHVPAEWRGQDEVEPTDY